MRGVACSRTMRKDALAKLLQQTRRAGAVAGRSTWPARGMGAVLSVRRPEGRCSGANGRFVSSAVVLIHIESVLAPGVASCRPSWSGSHRRCGGKGGPQQIIPSGSSHSSGNGGLVRSPGQTTSWVSRIGPSSEHRIEMPALRIGCRVASRNSLRILNASKSPTLSTAFLA